MLKTVTILGHLQDDENDEKASQVFEFIEFPSYVALISDDWSETD